MTPDERAALAPIPTDAGRIQRAVDALRTPDASLASVPNTVRQSLADVIEDLHRQVDRYGLALMMIREGAANPTQFARETLEGRPPPPPAPAEREALQDGREHLTTSGKFQSDKYPWCPAGFVPLKTTDPMAADLLAIYAHRRGAVDNAFRIDLLEALEPRPAPQDENEQLARWLLSFIGRPSSESEAGVNLARIAATLRAIPASGVEWQTMDTAPKDRGDWRANEILGWCPDVTAPEGGDRRVIWWEPKIRADGVLGCWYSDRDMAEKPTHWQILPAAPPPGGRADG